MKKIRKIILISLVLTFIILGVSKVTTTNFSNKLYADEQLPRIHTLVNLT